MARVASLLAASGSPISARGRSADRVLRGPRAPRGVPNGAARGPERRACCAARSRGGARVPCVGRRRDVRGAHVDPAGRARSARAHRVAGALPRGGDRRHERRADRARERARPRPRAGPGDPARHGARRTRSCRRLADLIASTPARAHRCARLRRRRSAPLVRARPGRVARRGSRARGRAFPRRGDDPRRAAQDRRLARGRHVRARARVARVRGYGVRVLRVLGVRAGRVCRHSGRRGGGAPRLRRRAPSVARASHRARSDRRRYPVRRPAAHAAVAAVERSDDPVSPDDLQHPSGVQRGAGPIAGHARGRDLARISRCPRAPGGRAWLDDRRAARRPRCARGTPRYALRVRSEHR